MQYFFLDNNRFTGVVPKTLCDMKPLQSLHLAKNNFACYYPCAAAQDSPLLVDYYFEYPQCAVNAPSALAAYPGPFRGG